MSLYGELDCSFIQLFCLQAEHDFDISKWLKKSQDKFKSQAIQNEIMEIMALKIVRDISEKISGKWYSVMVDETTDFSNKEQMVLRLWYVDDDMNIHEELIGLYNVAYISAEELVSVIKDKLLSKSEDQQLSQTKLSWCH